MPEVSKIKEVEGFLLSPQQNRLWKLQRNESRLPFRAQCAVAIEGNLRSELLQEAVSQVVDRHEILRTSFQPVQGMETSLQVVHEHGLTAWRTISLLHCALQEQEARIERFFEEDGSLAFDLTQPGLVRVTLLTLSDHYHILVITLPALCADAWTLKNLVSEISQTYSERLKKGEPDEEVTPYVQFSAWQNELLGGEEAQQGKDFWQGQLAQSNAPALTAVFSGRPVSTGSFAPVSLVTVVAPEVTAKIKLLAHHYDTTVEQFLLACWQILIWRLTRHQEFTIATASDGRKYEELREVCGPIAKWLPINSRFTTTLLFTDVLDQLYQSATETYEWQEYFIWSETSAPAESTKDFPEVGFEFEQEFPQHLAGDITLSLYRQFVCFDRFQIKLLCALRNDTLVTEVQYDANIFQAVEIERLSGQFQTLLRSVVQQPDQPVTDFDILTSAERQRLLVEFNQTDTDYPSDESITYLFEQQVLRTPDALAVEFADGSLSYSQLNGRANQLAHYLLSLGLGAESPVGLCLEHNCNLIVGALAVLKAGACYLPLDPAYPIERLSFMLDDARVSFLLTDEQLQEQLPADSRQVILLDRDRALIETQSDLNPGHCVDAQNLAYIIYTSGSTGVPKGISISHRGVIRLVCDTNYIRLGPGLRMAQASNASFDAATFELWGALLHGGCVVGLERESMLSPEALAGEIERQQIDVLFLTTALFNQVARYKPQAFGGLRELLFGGEAVDVKWVRRVLESGGPGRLLHVYGPTESTTFATWHEIQEVGELAQTIPIGRALANTKTYVLDEERRPVPIGVAGELYLGGDGLARGYLGRAELTAERFVPDQWSGQQGARLYRTGDVVRYDEQGNIEFIGRVDEQVKIRGYRIELGEIEAALSGHSGVAEVVVVARQEESGERRLVAYVVGTGARESGSELVSELRSYLRERVPEYMVPGAIVRLEQLPLTANGKVDRRGLPAPEEVEREGEGMTGPRTPTEELVAGSWAELLGLREVGVEENFFDLGGHSLLATQVISRVREMFGVELALRSLFEGPTVAGLSLAIEEAQREGAGISAPPIVAVARGEELRLSFAQQRLWFLDQLEPGSAFYNVPSAVRLTGELNIEALEETLTEIVRRHEALRTMFVTVDGEPRQVIAAPARLRVPVTDLSSLSEAERETEAMRLAGEEAQRGFDLSRGPLLRASLIRLGAEECIVLLTMHHIVSDGWSMGVLIGELSTLYVSFLAGEESPLPELSLQYADFAHWQQEWLQGEVLENQLNYWKQQLEAASAVLELPTDRPRPTVQTFRGASHKVQLSHELTSGLKALSRQEGLTLFMTLLAAFQILLSRHTGQRGISVGSPIANRNRQEIEPLIGFFVNTLVLHTEVRATESFREMLARVRDVTLGAYAHQDLPFEKLVEELQPQRKLSSTPLFQVMFVYQNAGDGGAVELPGLQMRGMETEQRTAKFELTLAMSEGKDGLGATFEYNTDLFDARTIERMGGHFQRLLESIVAEPQQQVSKLTMLGEGERQQLLVEWNETGAEYPTGETIQQLFEAQVERTPEQVAVSWGEQQLSYRELNQRANQLAHHLRRLGVGPEGRVGVLLERNLEMVVSLLGILKAGGAYVPLDPNYPQSRLAFMLADAKAQLLLTQHSLREVVRPGAETGLLCVDEEQAVIGSYPQTNPEEIASSGNLAYLIYTSGSTGRPKGVAIEHHSTTTLIHWAQATFAPTALRVVLASTSLCFDLSVFELFVPLSCGGQVVVCENALALPSLEVRETVTLINTVPSAMAELVRQQALPDSVEVVNLAGEALGRSLVEAVYEELPGVVVYNLYGPSEDTTYSTAALVERGEERAPAIGRPIANTQGYVLDEGLELLPVGVSGELYLSGAGVARGYLERAELTAERFVPNPYGVESGARMYRTGDQARWSGQGELEYLGRIDQQVKLRGYRIELGEIEARLRQHEAVNEAVVVVREEDGDKRLVAYLVGAGAEVASVSELRRFLGEKLPEYMIPSVYVTLDELPLTANGKVNRRALPAPDAAHPDLADSFVATRNAVEQTLASIWSNLLKLTQVGVHDNFFELGGDSILSIQIVARAQQAGLRLTPKQLFQHQTIAELAEVVGTAHVVLAEQGVVSGEVALTPIQHWFFEQQVSEMWHYNQALMLEVREGADAGLLERAVREVIEHHDALRMRYMRADGGEWRQENASEQNVDGWWSRDLSAVKKSEQAAAIEAEVQRAQQSLDLLQGPVIRVVYMELGERQAARLLVVAHHLVMDGVSWRVMLEDIVGAYQQLERGAEKVSLAAKTTSYQQWAKLLAEYGRSEEVSREADYWLSELQRPVSRLKIDYDLGSGNRAEIGDEIAAVNTVASMKQVQVSLSAEETQALLTNVPSAYQTQINEVLLAALASAHQRWSGEPRLLVEVEGHGREGELLEADLSRTVGWFTTIYPVMLEVGGSDEGDHLKSVKEHLRGLAHGGLNFGVLRYLGPPEIRERLAHMPVADVSFNYLGQFDQVLNKGGLLRPARESTGLGHSPAGKRPYLLEISGGISEGRLQLAWIYSSALHRQESIEEFAGEYIEALRRIIAHCQEEEAGGFTPSDFPEAALSQKELDQLVAALSE